MNPPKKNSILSQWRERQGQVQQSSAAGSAIPNMMSPGQERLWFLQQLYPENSFYNHSEWHEFRGQLDRRLFLEALREILDKQKQLRAYFPAVEGKPSVKFDRSGRPEINYLSSDSFIGSPQWREELAHKPFDLAEPGLCKVFWVEFDADHFGLLMVVHHIIVSKWSMQILLNQVAEQYHYLKEGGKESTLSLQKEFTDFAFAQKNKEHRADSIEFWKGELNTLKTHDFFEYKKVSTKPSFEGRTFKRVVPTALSQKIVQQAKQEGVTLYTWMLTVFFELLRRYFQDHNFGVGTPVENRPDPAYEKVVGFFNNTFVFVNPIDGSSNFKEGLQKVKTQLQSLLPHVLVPFEELVAAHSIEREAHKNSFFNTMFVSGKEGWNPQLADTEWSSQVVLTKNAKFDLTFFVFERPEGMEWVMEYAVSVFEKEQADSFMSQIQELAERFLEDPDQKMREVQLTGEGPVPTAENPQPSLQEYTNFSDLFKGIAKVNTEKIAVVDHQGTMTYEALWREAQHLAQRLLRHYPNEKRIGVLTERKCETVVGILGTVLAGKSYVPLDPKYPSNRLQMVIEDAALNCILSTPDVQFKQAKELIQPISVSGQQQDDNNIQVSMDPQDDIYVIYTSGSTGKPKGVPISHQNLLFSTAARLAYYTEQPEHFLLLSSMAFDSSKAGLFWTLATGGTLHLVPDGFEQDVDAFSNYIQQKGITHTLMLPSLYSLMLEMGNSSALNSLKNVIVAGEACTPSLVQLHFDRLPNTKLFNEYGPTEATVWSSVHRCRETDAHGPVPIGRPIPGVELWVLGKDLKPVPKGVVGELFIGGEGLSKAYLNQEEKTTQAFIYAELNGLKQRLYKSGDRVYMDSEGLLHFLGRGDDQLKIRGYRIELSEIEAVMRTFPGIQEAFVVPSYGKDPKKATGLRSFYRGEETTEEAFRPYLEERLPAYMVPATFQKIEEIPSLPNGKVDRKKLKQLQGASQPVSGKRLSELSTIESQLSTIWQEVLGLNSVDIDADFFSLGGDSLLSIRVIAKAKKHFTLPASALFEFPTIRSLARYAEKGELNQQTKKDQPLPKLSLSPIQHWFLTQLQGPKHYWNQAWILPLKEPVSRGDLEQFIVQVLAKHEVLRYNFLEEEEWKISVRSWTPENLPLFTSNVQGDTNALWPEVQSMQEGVNLSELPLFQIWMNTVGDHSSQLLFWAHHLVVDEVSWNLLFEEWDQWTASKKDYLKNDNGIDQTYRRWSNSQSTVQLSPQELSYWKKASVHPLRTDKVTEGLYTEKDMVSSIQRFDFVQRTEERAILDPFGLQLDEFLIAALGLTLEEYAIDKRLSLSLEKHGRNPEQGLTDVTGTVGWMTSFYPFTLPLDKTADRGAFLIALKELYRAIPGQGRGFQIINQESKEGAMPMPEVTFNFLGHASGDDKRHFVTQGMRHPDMQSSAHIELNARIVESTIELYWRFSNKHWQKETQQLIQTKMEENLIQLKDYCLGQNTTSYSPSDFGEVDIDQDDLDTLLNSL